MFLHDRDDSEASDSVLLGYLAGREDLPPREVVLGLEILASRAHNRLQAGWSETHGT